MTKAIHIDKKADKEISALPRAAQIKFRALLNILLINGRLELPEGKKISKDLFEMRFSEANIYRSIYAYLGKEVIIVLSVFTKKTQKTPLKELKKAQSRLLHYV